ncbi:hypothetical protein SNUCP2_05240 [Clostridium perfringens A]|nr:AAA family ATPase [Clostridium perfringens]HBC2033278.1 AAA family ATPase [Clostridium perfringens]HBC2056685.1 AAA family ATPase [Clostridium perfringens]HBC2070805.1 AAA family ATPase [Clostridium perfringens]
MFLSKLKIWNFRKYGTKENEEAGITILFNERLNLIVGENDSGKTAIIDAIKLVLGTQSYDNVRLEENDFYRERNGKRSNSLKIECTFEKLSDIEAGRFLEWIYIDDEGNAKLEVRLTARIKDNKITIRKTGGKEGVDINFEASENLRVTYLKPLRDAEHELNPGYRSRFAQVLKSHPIFKNNGDEHMIEKIMKGANKNIEDYFKGTIFQNDNQGEECDEILESDYKGDPSSIIKSISETLGNFLGADKNQYNVNINISEMELNKILSRLMLKIDEDKVGLGTLNQLYMAMELLLLDIKETNNEFGLALIEEIEAHIHPQAQLRVIKHLEEHIKSQTIITTHSITLASIANLSSLILCRNNSAYSLNNEYTRLSSGDYEFLERFLDSTKANLFFAKGVIMVEGDAENILIPTIAKIIGKPLYMHGVSIVNVGNVAFLRYSNIFISKEGDKTIGIPTSIVTDLDVRPAQYYQDKDNDCDSEVKYTVYEIKSNKECFINKKISRNRLKEILGRTSKQILREREYLEKVNIIENDYEKYKEVVRTDKERKYNFKDIKVFTNQWTMEFDLALSCIREYMHAAILIAKDIKSDEGVIDDISIKEYIDKSKEEIEEFIVDNKNDMEIAYEIYKPLLRGNASKAVSAQYLSKILLKKSYEDEELSKRITEDEQIKYIVDSIYHVTNVRSEVTE